LIELSRMNGGAPAGHVEERLSVPAPEDLPGGGFDVR
jgi:hypothetical protein